MSAIYELYSIAASIARNFRIALYSLFIYSFIYLFIYLFLIDRSEYDTLLSI